MLSQNEKMQNVLGILFWFTRYNLLLPGATEL